MSQFTCRVTLGLWPFITVGAGGGRSDIFFSSVIISFLFLPLSGIWPDID